MADDGDYRDSRLSGRESDGDDGPSTNLWVGNLSMDTIDSDLMTLFAKHGVLDCVMTFSSRNFAFLYFKSPDDAKAAKDDLQGALVRGNSIKIEFARPPLGGPYESPLSKVLLIRYPPSVRIDEQMLHNAMILFGEIEHVKSFPSRSSSFVEFRSVDEARRAKEGLQGRLFNDPRIQILYSNSEFAQPKDDFLFGSGQGGGGGPRQDMIYGDHPFGRTKYFHRGGYPNNFPGSLPPNNMPGMGRPFPPRGFFDGGSEFLDDSAYHFREGVNFSRLSPVPGRQSPTISLPGMWDGFDARDAKRSRIDGSPFDEASLRGRRMDSQILRNPYALNGPDRVAAGPSSPMGAKRSAAGFPIRDHCWRGIIAKGGTHVCHARCVPVGKGVDSPLPEVVNCSARTGLDMLSKHYEEADGFDIVFFLPDSEDDFASYTEFLQYLRLKNRAGVAKLDDGTTLFLVPPSDFLTQVLKVSGPERLYGVVLKIPQQLGAPTSHYTERQQTPPAQSGYAASRLSEDRVPSLEYSRPLQEELLPRSTAGRPFSAQSLPISYGSNPMTSQPVEVSLTPELIATLAAVIPTSALATSTGPVQPPLSSTVRAPSVSVHWFLEMKCCRSCGASSLRLQFLVAPITSSLAFLLFWLGNSLQTRMIRFVHTQTLQLLLKKIYLAFNRLHLSLCCRSIAMWSRNKVGSSQGPSPACRVRRMLSLALAGVMGYLDQLRQQA
ncbi:unnamed protein product [Spirodela intermedia]|uniref:RRM domain-containing protein n=1 Tax=Spirodela intermedia TaxID=51605 RepID=A0A7I8J169_SPIIN|nr:unnamed protein product [Spirodela intermedia]CAA6663877.1 unnamed protein product [Spirodela intermedia]